MLIVSKKKKDKKKETAPLLLFDAFKNTSNRWIKRKALLNKF